MVHKGFYNTKKTEIIFILYDKNGPLNSKTQCLKATIILQGNLKKIGAISS